MILNEKQENFVDKVYPPFSEKRRELRKAWTNHMQLVDQKEAMYIGWDQWLLNYARLEMQPDLPF